MEVQEFLNQRKELQNYLLEFIDCLDDNTDDETNLFNLLNSYNFEENPDEFKIFLHLILSISRYHQRHQQFFNKVEKILHHFSEGIKQAFTDDFEIFDFFKSNKRLLLFLFNEKIITLDHSILKILTEKRDKNGTKYLHYFYPEIKSSLKIGKIKMTEKELLSDDPNFFNNLENNRQTGENESYICSLIRNDSVEEFITYVNRKNISLLSKIKPSIFETNSFLIENNESSLIEYAAFYGSIQIFNYLRLNKVDLTSSLWLYSIHGRNPELIHLLEGNDVKPPNNSYKDCLIESIKCHHNEITSYIQDNLIDKSESMSLNDSVFLYSLKYENFAFFDNEVLLFYACKCNNIDIVKRLLSMDGVDCGKSIEKQKFSNNNKKKSYNFEFNEFQRIFYILKKIEFRIIYLLSNKPIFNSIV